MAQELQSMSFSGNPRGAYLRPGRKDTERYAPNALMNAAFTMLISVSLP
jgi:hypothetical protein